MCSDLQCGQTKTTLHSCYVTNLAAVCAATCPRQSPVTPSQQSPAQAIQEPTAQPAQLLYSLLVTFYVTTPYVLAVHILPLVSFLTLHCLALQQHWLQAQPCHQHLHLAFWAILLHMPKFTTCKAFNLACILLLQLSLWLWQSLHTGIPEHSKHNISQVHRRIARATCTT